MPVGALQNLCPVKPRGVQLRLSSTPFLVLCFLFYLIPAAAFGKTPIADFKLAPALFENNSIHIRALDSAGNEDLTVNGRYRFTVNGFEKRLLFIGGNAEYPDNLKGSTFLYMKYEGLKAGTDAADEVVKTVPRLFFVYRSDAGLVPVQISLFWLLAIPVLLLVISFIFKRLLILAILIIVLFFVFNKGLPVSRYGGAVKDWIHAHS